MKLTTDFIPIFRYYWGQTKLKLGLIKLRPWKDEPFWREWAIETLEKRGINLDDRQRDYLYEARKAHHLVERFEEVESND